MTPLELIASASQFARRFKPSEDCTSGDVAAALVTVAGHIYTGVCLDSPCSLGFCAEQAAVAEMMKAQESEIRLVVAVDQTGTVRVPCGRCRELMWQLNPNNRTTRVVVAPDDTVPLESLLPRSGRNGPRV